MRGRAGNEEPEQMQGVNGGYQVPYQIEAAINRGNFTPSKWVQWDSLLPNVTLTETKNGIE